MKKISTTLTVFCCLFLLQACSTTSAPVSENKPGTMKQETVQEIQTGIITHVNNVAVQVKRNGYGRMAGGTLGGIAGGSVGSGYGSVAGSILGRVVGGVIGSRADENSSKKPGLEITVRLDNGQHVTVTQLQTDKVFKSGQRVKLVMKNGAAQVEHAS